MKTLLEFDYKKATQAINFFIKKEGGQIDKLKLIKLIYFADRYHLRNYGRPIINDTYFAMPKGPVASSVKDIVEFSGFLAEEELQYAEQFIKKGPIAFSIISIANLDETIFSQGELEALNFSFETFGHYQSLTLVDITHTYPEWEKFKSILESKETTREPMSYEDFFKNPDNTEADKFRMSNERLSASKEVFDENFKVAEFWK
ncbi:MAG: hypothetical protein RIQ72_272 [Candidatus Parcubacteria bacterium]|jgi:uncharacterized phage-associated protein